jgi:sortase (surface protein transpeptidase)
VPARWLRSLVLTTVALVLFSFVISRQAAPQPPPQPDARQALRQDSAPASATPPPGERAAALPASSPVRVRIPGIGVDAPLTGLGLDPEGRLAAPPEADANLAGWYSDGIPPGSRGTAIVAGHVDNASGPAVFYDLGALKKGMAIDIDRADRRTARFVVDAVEVYEADDFPSATVYQDADRPELRVITCGGGYDRQRHRYRGNVVVFAHLQATPGQSSG